MKITPVNAILMFTGAAALSTAVSVGPALNKRYAQTKPDTVEISTKAFSDLSTPENIVKTSKNVLGEAWNVNLNPTNNMVELTLLPPKERSFMEIIRDVNNNDYYNSAHKTPAQIKAIYGLQDGVLKKHNNLKSMWYNFRESLHIKTGVNDIDFAFKRGAKIKFPLDEVGKNIEACKRYLKDGVVEIIEKATDGSITKSVWSKVHL